MIGKSSARYLCKTFSDKIAGFQSIGCDFIGNNVKAIVEDYLYGNADADASADADAEISKWP